MTVISVGNLEPERPEPWHRSSGPCRRQTGPSTVRQSWAEVAEHPQILSVHIYSLPVFAILSSYRYRICTSSVAQFDIAVRKYDGRAGYCHKLVCVAYLI